jgi:hypothetical protein
MVRSFVLGRVGCIIITLLSTVNVVHHYFHGPQSMSKSRSSTVILDQRSPTTHPVFKSLNRI